MFFKRAIKIFFKNSLDNLLKPAKVELFINQERSFMEKFTRKVLYAEFIAKVKEELKESFGDLSDANVRLISKVFFDAIGDLISEDGVDYILLPIGKFQIGTTKACERYIPKLGHKIELPESHKVVFKPAAPFLAKLNDRDDLNIIRDYAYKKRTKTVDVTEVTQT